MTDILRFVFIIFNPEVCIYYIQSFWVILYNKVHLLNINVFGMIHIYFLSVYEFTCVYVVLVQMILFTLFREECGSLV